MPQGPSITPSAARAASTADSGIVFAALAEARHADVDDFELHAQRVSTVDGLQHGHCDFGDFGPDVIAGHDCDMHLITFR